MMALVGTSSAFLVASSPSTRQHPLPTQAITSLNACDTEGTRLGHTKRRQYLSLSPAKPWDPLAAPKESPSSSCVSRVTRDIQTLMAAPLPGILVMPEASDITMVHTAAA